MPSVSEELGVNNEVCAVSIGTSGWSQFMGGMSNEIILFSAGLNGCTMWHSGVLE